MTTLWRINNTTLERTSSGRLNTERSLEEWIESDPSTLDPDLMIIGRQITAGDSGRIDLLAIRGDGSLQIIELKRDLTPREIVAQILEYASWVEKLSTSEVHQIAQSYSAAGRLPSLSERFRETFDKALPETLNTSHGMLIVASELDRRSKRIVEYLSEVHSVAINTAFFNVFVDEDRQYLAADWLIDQEAVTERTDVRTKAPWTGEWYANVGDDQSRSWEDMRKYGFLAAGGGRHYSGRLDQLTPGDKVYAYQKKMGYVGYGVVLGEAVRASDHKIAGTPLLHLPLTQANLAHDAEDNELAEYVVPVDWKKTYPLSDAKTFPGAFANQNIVCRLRDQATLEFLKKTFGAN